jgi:hypothetical protein
MEQYRAMLLTRSGEARVKMGFSMNSARALILTSVLAQDPQASPVAVRRALFLRFYGHEFNAGERERIMAGLDRDDDTSAEVRVAVGSRRQPRASEARRDVSHDGDDASSRHHGGHELTNWNARVRAGRRGPDAALASRQGLATAGEAS